MADGMLVDRDALQRLFRMLRWYEGGGHFAPPRTTPEPRLIPHELRRFELAEALTPGGEALCWLRKWDADAGDYATSDDTSLQFTVADPLGGFRGRAKDAYASPHDAGSRGLAWKPHDCPQWEVVELTPAAVLVAGSVKGAFASTDATFTADGVTVLSPEGGLIVTQDPTADFTIQNTFAWDGNDNATFVAVWNGSQWLALQVACPA